jgi:G3E family GTPase
MANSRRPSDTPMTLISGFKGSGKTTLIEHLVKESRSLRLVVLEDDGEKDLFTEIEEASQLHASDAILIECAAALEPFFIAEHLIDGDEESPPPEGVRVDTLVTVVDASTFLKEIKAGHDLLDIGLAFDEEDDRMVSELLIEQIEFADVLVLNKTDLVTTEEGDELESLLGRLNPRARILRTEFGRVPPGDLISTGYFDLEETDDGAGWLAELSNEFVETDGAFDVSSFTFIERRPFHPIRFNELLSDFQAEGLIRAKGYVWVASRHHEIGIWSLAGKASLLTYGGNWFASTPGREWPEDERERIEIMKDWMAPFGDRRQEIAFIGLHMNEEEITRRLEQCLLTNDEMVNGPHAWFGLPDPLPDWHEDTDPESSV